MSVGLPVTKNELDTRSGDIARAFQRLAGDTTTLKGYLDSATEETLVELGYTANDVAVMKTAITDLEQLLVQIGYGLAPLPAPKDFTAFLRQLWGVGALMAVGSLSPVAIQQFFDNNGNPLSFGSLGFFLAGTETPTPAYADVNLTIPLANPVPLDIAGRAPELFLGAVTYKQVLKNALGTTLWTADNIVTPTALRSISTAISITGDQSDVLIPSGVITYVEFTNATDLTVDGFAGGTPGQVLLLQARGPGNVFLENHTSSASAAQNRLHNPILSGPVPMTPFGGSAMYVYQADKWLLVTHEQGHWIRVPFNAANFTGNPAEGGVWVVEAADVKQLDYKLSGTSLLITIGITGASIAANTTHVRINNLPYAFNTAVQALPATGKNTTTYELAALGIAVVGDRMIVFAKATLQPWTLSTDQMELYAQVFLDVQ